MWRAADGSGPAPSARHKHCAAALGGHIYVLGGRSLSGNMPLRDFWRYSLDTCQWERVNSTGEAPPALQEHSCVAHGGCLYVFGGEPAARGDTPLWVFEERTRIWRAPRSRGPSGRRGHSAHALQDCMLIYGGYKDLRGSTDELWAFHYESETWRQVRTGGAGPARHRHAAALHDDRLYVHGGRCDLHECGDMWHYDTMSRVWRMVRTRGPSPRSGHAGIKVGAHLYLFGGEAQGHATDDLWRFHFATETWERVERGMVWPAPRVDGRLLLVGGEPPPAAPRPAPPQGLLISKLSSFHIRRSARCSYSVLAADRDSTESLALPKSRSAYVIDGRPAGEVARDPLSVPDFSDMALPPPALSPATKLVYLDSDEEEEARREAVEAREALQDAVEALPASASVRFSRGVRRDDLSTSDYASEHRLSLGFSNPHYSFTRTPDSGLELELSELAPRSDMTSRGEMTSRAEVRARLLLVGGKEPTHLAALRRPLVVWTYRFA